MFKKNPQLIKNKGNKYPSIKFHLGHSFAIREGLLRINKRRLIENIAQYENGYRFHSHHSKANLTIRTQSATIARSLVPLVLYIYKKGKCVESLTIPGKHVDSQKRLCHIGYINQFFATPIVHSSSQSIRGGRKFTLIRIARCNGWAG